ncbi:MAG: PQQ-like beta-propeller repeat protein, partial [Deltaproteobacteria bacterium]|nr:PQQ-like beta-propeller repeat protein [Deltaproteobacteria bacterium]
LGKPRGEVDVAEINEWSKKLYEDVDISTRGKIGVGGFDQTVRVYDRRGRVIWKHKIPTGVVRCVRFSPTGDYLFAGEASPDGNIYCFCAKTGKLCWKCGAVKDVGASSETYYGHQPKICSIVCVGERIYVSAARNQEDYITVGSRKVKYWPKRGVIYALDLKTGELLWKFPATGSMDTSPLKVSVDASGRYLTFGGWGGSADGRIRQKYPENTLYLLDAINGALIWRYSVPPVEKHGFQSISIGGNSHISPNGKYVACCSSDGRFFLFDMAKSVEKKMPHLIYKKAISTPIKVSGIPIYAYGGKVFVDDEGSAFLTIGRTYVAPAGKGMASTPDVKHPSENSIIKLDRDGNTSWLWPAKGPIETPVFSKNGRYLVVAMCHNYVERSNEMAGIYCFDLKRQGGGADKLIWYYRMEGLGLACGISPCGKYIGAIEGPVDIDPRREYQNIVGKHRVCILS